MKIPKFIRRKLTEVAMRISTNRAPDVVIGDEYLLRWWVIPRNRFFNVYLHHILTSDDDRALHDHPWLNCSLIVDGGYFEHTIEAGGVHRRVWRDAGTIKFRGGKSAHRLEIAPDGYAVTFFVTGPRFRTWGFHCTEAGWIPWQKFCASDDPSKVGSGCGQ